MQTEAITLQVDPETAKAFRELAPEKREQIAFELSLGLRRRVGVRKPPTHKEMFALMDKISERAEAQGLTPEILQSILDEK
jgi:hypothetical protein